MRSTFPLLLALPLLTLTTACAMPAAADLSVGDPAPPFELTGSDGKTYTLDGLLASHKGIVLAWFPKAFTSG